MLTLKLNSKHVRLLFDLNTKRNVRTAVYGFHERYLQHLWANQSLRSLKNSSNAYLHVKPQIPPASSLYTDLGQAKPVQAPALYLTHRHEVGTDFLVSLSEMKANKHISQTA